jgi:hypothetical protein
LENDFLNFLVPLKKLINKKYFIFFKKYFSINKQVLLEAATKGLTGSSNERLAWSIHFCGSMDLNEHGPKPTLKVQHEMRAIIHC